MIKHILFTLFIFLTSISFAQDAFCDGWEKGYKNAHEDNNEFLGITPICPIPGIHQKTYRAGYNSGYKKALKKIGIEDNNTITHINDKSKTFCDGWEEGYKNGHEDNNVFLGITPICPIPGIHQDTYRAGYNLGYKKSLKNIGIEESHLSVTSSDRNKTFCEGWEEGYKNGHEDNNEFLGITPICPIAKIGIDTYRAGYSLGYKKALRKIN